MYVLQPIRSSQPSPILQDLSRFTKSELELFDGRHADIESSDLFEVVFETYLIIAELPADAEEALLVVHEKLQVILDSKRERSQWKLRSVYRAFRDEIRPALLKRREEEPALRQARDLSALDVRATAPTEMP